MGSTRAMRATSGIWKKVRRMNGKKAGGVPIGTTGAVSEEHFCSKC